MGSSTLDTTSTGGEFTDVPGSVLTAPVPLYGIQYDIERASYELTYVRRVPAIGVRAFTLPERELDALVGVLGSDLIVLVFLWAD